MLFAYCVEADVHFFLDMMERNMNFVISINVLVIRTRFPETLSVV